MSASMSLVASNSRETIHQRSAKVRLDDSRHSQRSAPTDLSGAFRYFITRGSPRILIAATFIAATARIAVGQWSTSDLVPIIVLIVLWPLQEWLIHVFILHFKPFELVGRTIDFAVPRKHREHHRDPGNLEILFIPIHSFIYTLPLSLIIFFALSPTTAIALTGLTTYFLFALNYEWIHFLVHTRVVPKSAAYRRLWKSHRLHHFKNEHYWMGVTRLGADWLLGTTPDQTAVPTSPTCRQLHGE